MGALEWGLKASLQFAHSLLQLRTSVALLGPFLRELSSQNDDNHRQSCHLDHCDSSCDVYLICHDLSLHSKSTVCKTRCIVKTSVFTRGVCKNR